MPKLNVLRRQDQSKKYELYYPPIPVEFRVGSFHKKFEIVRPNLMSRVTKVFDSFSRRPFVGLDIGSSEIKLVQVQRTQSGFELQKIDKIAVSAESIVDGTIMHFGEVNRCLKELFARNNIENVDVAMAVSGHSVILKTISMPQMSEDELSKSIHWEAEKYIPFHLKEVSIDTCIIDPVGLEGQMEVLLGAVKTDSVLDYVSVIQGLGHRPMVIDCEAVVLANVGRKIIPDIYNKTVCLVSIGRQVMDIIILSHGVVQFTRDICLGGGLVTEEIQRQFNETYDFCEELKVTGGEAIASKANREQFDLMIQKCTETLVTEIQRSIVFCQTTSVNSEIDDIYITGGAFRVPGFAEDLENRSGITVNQLNPFDCLIVDQTKFSREALDEFMSQYSIAVGLAMRG